MDPIFVKYNSLLHHLVENPQNQSDRHRIHRQLQFYRLQPERGKQRECRVSCRTCTCENEIIMIDIENSLP